LLIGFFLVYSFIGNVTLGFSEGLHSLIEVLTNANFYLSIKNTLVFCFFSSILATIIGFIIALLLDTNIKGKRFFRALLFVPWVIPFATVGLVWKFLLHDQFGVVIYIMKILRFPNILLPSLSLPNTAMYGVLICNSWIQTSFAMLVLHAALQTIPDELWAAAKVDGANYRQGFFYITLPLLRNHLTIVTILIFIWAANAFAVIWFMTKGGPLSSTEILSIYAYNEAFEKFRFDRAAIVSIFQMIIIFIVAYPYFKFLHKKD
jgi:ABC-type sugar transport system permease subunit